MRYILPLLIVAFLSCTKSNCVGFQLSQSYIQQDKIILEYSSALDPAYLPAPEAYTAQITTDYQDIELYLEPSISGNKVILSAGDNIAGFKVLLSYSNTGPNAIRSTCGTVADSFVNKLIQ